MLIYDFTNFVQDLPNNMIHQVAIKSLPQEWLWCETWCDDKSKKKAKTIDLVSWSWFKLVVQINNFAVISGAFQVLCYEGSLAGMHCNIPFLPLKHFLLWDLSHLVCTKSAYIKAENCTKKLNVIVS